MCNRIDIFLIKYLMRVYYRHKVARFCVSNKTIKYSNIVDDGQGTDQHPLLAAEIAAGGAVPARQPQTGDAHERQHRNQEPREAHHP